MKNAEQLTFELNDCAVEHAELIARAAKIDSEYVTYMFTINAITSKPELLKIATAAKTEAKGIDKQYKPVNGNFSVDALQKALIAQRAQVLGVEETHKKIAELAERMSDLQAAIANVDRLNMFASVLGDTENASIFETLASLVFELKEIDRPDMAIELTRIVLRNSFRDEIAVYDAIEEFVRTVADARAAQVAPEVVNAEPAAKSSKK